MITGRLTLRREKAALSALVFIFLFSSCSKKYYHNTTSYQFKSITGKPEYKVLDYWASHPWKKDAADNIPSDLKGEKTDSLADVFFIHPTTYTNITMPMGWNAVIDNEELNRKTDNTTILYQASVFNNCCRIFAPRYRQANLKAFFTNDKEKANEAFDTAYNDIKKAFEYYMQHFNNDCPIIIASHSQGTLHAARLLKEFFEGKPLQKKLVAAYLIGLPVFENFFITLKPCHDAVSTGCIISWRTFKEGYEPAYVQKEKVKAHVTNPLTWSLSNEYAPASLNKGGILKNFNKIIPGLVHARVHGNILWVNKPRFFGNIFFALKNYHIVDYNLFYLNIRTNVRARIEAYFKK